MKDYNKLLKKFMQPRIYAILGIVLAITVLCTISSGFLNLILAALIVAFLVAVVYCTVQVITHNTFDFNKWKDDHYDDWEG